MNVPFGKPKAVLFRFIKVSLIQAILGPSCASVTYMKIDTRSHSVHTEQRTQLSHPNCDLYQLELQLVPQQHIDLNNKSAHTTGIKLYIHTVESPYRV